MMAMMIPPNFRRRFPDEWKNIRKNAGIVTSPFDIHETLRHLLKLSAGGGHFVGPDGTPLSALPSDEWVAKNGEGRGGRKAASTEQNRRRIGTSLFTPLPSLRGCADAGIETHWCTCLETTPLSTSNSYAVASAKAVVDVINDMIEDSGERLRCYEWELAALTAASRVRPNEGVLKYRESRDRDHRIPGFRQFGVLSDVEEYRVTFVVRPKWIVNDEQTTTRTGDVEARESTKKYEIKRMPAKVVKNSKGRVDGLKEVKDVEDEEKLMKMTATFEATVRVHLTDDDYVVQGVSRGEKSEGGQDNMNDARKGEEAVRKEWNGDGISRLDRYGDQPQCIQKEKPHLRKFCLCRFSILI